MENMENTIKKMGLVIEKLAQKIDEMDKRIAKLEERSDNDIKTFSSNDIKASTPTPPVNNSQPQKSSSGGFLSSLFGSAVGAFAGMSLFNALFNDDVKPDEMAQNMNVDSGELSDLEARLNEIDSKLDEVDNKLDDVADNNFVDDDSDVLADNDFDNSFDDEGFGDFDV